MAEIIPFHTNKPGTEKLIFRNMDNFKKWAEKFINFKESAISLRKITLKTRDVYYWANYYDYTESSVFDSVVPIIYEKITKK